jgi:hypothetical protein
VRVTTDDGAAYVIEAGRVRARRAVINPRIGQRLLRRPLPLASAEPPAEARGELANELLDRFRAGSNLLVEREVSGLPAGVTVASATLTIRAAPAGAAVSTTAGAVTPLGGGVARLRFTLPRERTAPLRLPHAFDVRVTLAGAPYDGWTVTPVLGTAYAALGVADLVATVPIVGLAVTPATATLETAAVVTGEGAVTLTPPGPPALTFAAPGLSLDSPEVPPVPALTFAAPSLTLQLPGGTEGPAAPVLSFADPGLSLTLPSEVPVPALTFALAELELEAPEDPPPPPPPPALTFALAELELTDPDVVAITGGGSGELDAP